MLTSTSRRVAAVAIACAATVAAQPAVASAQPVAGSSASAGIDLRQGAWDTRNALHDAANGLPPEMAQGAKNAVDGAVNGLFPGVIAEKEAEIRAAAERAEAERRAAEEAAAAQRAAAERAAFDRGPCPDWARACVDLKGERSWLQDGHGNVTYGAVPISSGAPGYETPTGVHRVNRQVKDEISREFNNAPMPYSTYFTNNGIAFHAGSVALLSHGCIHLNHGDAVRYFNDLKPGDVVFVY
ncbi:L,D-transpeptidase [Corynebacterium aquilae]|uniref:Peptidase n=1 Tax=Corynebacterium aquilae DSM 44791 TaxID=1431546 RepID=A0A1L7CDZ5_9CORY|nr:L,D-transpeptidase [Corynebacterium aquilae]APT84057.1 peptidase [Corynebacterium aquilae DSM 44791]